MTPVTSAKGKPVALFGLGGSGLATAQALLAGGASVTAWDDGEASRDKARAAGITLADLREADWSVFASLVLAPGVPLTHPEPHWAARMAHAAGVEIIGDIELFARERVALAPNAPFIAITGTNGKSTTTALTAHLFRTAGWDVQMGGNIGTPVLALQPPADNRVHVLELSTFQIDLTPTLHPSVGMMINLTPDHLDRHGTMENYAAIKERVVAGARASLTGIDDPYGHAIYGRLAGKAEAYAVSVREVVEQGLFRDGSRIMMRKGAAAPRALGDLSAVGRLRGLHNAQNAAFALGAAALYSLDPAVLQHGLESFPGLAHRMELVAHRGRVLFVNDSKATNADAAEQSLKSFESIHWIVGGVAKAGGIASLEPLFSRVAKAYLIGKSSDDFAAQIGGKIPFERCETLERAVAAAARDAAASSAPEPAVLLAPACASYDQYRNFELRGDHFRALVDALPHPTGEPARGEHP